MDEDSDESLAWPHPFWWLVAAADAPPVGCIGAQAFLTPSSTYSRDAVATLGLVSLTASRPFMEHSRNAKVRTGFPQRRQPSTQQPAAQKRNSPTDPHPSADSAGPQTFTGGAQPIHSQPHADHGVQPGQSPQPDIRHPSSMENPSRAGPLPVPPPFPPIKEEKDASDHKLKAGNEAYGVKMESKIDGNRQPMRGGYPSRSRAPSPTSMSGPLGAAPSHQAPTSVGSRFPAQGPRSLPVRSAYGFGRLPLRKGYNEVIESHSAEDNLVDPTKPVEVGCTL